MEISFLSQFIVGRFGILSHYFCLIQFVGEVVNLFLQLLVSDINIRHLTDVVVCEFALLRQLIPLLLEDFQ